MERSSQLIILVTCYSFLEIVWHLLLCFEKYTGKISCDKLAKLMVKSCCNIIMYKLGPKSW